LWSQNAIGSAMKWVPKEALLALQANLLADDVPLEPVMETWDEAAQVAYLESGGSVRLPQSLARPTSSC